MKACERAKRFWRYYQCIELLYGGGTPPLRPRPHEQSAIPNGWGTVRDLSEPREGESFLRELFGRATRRRV